MERDSNGQTSVDLRRLGDPVGTCQRGCAGLPMDGVLMRVISTANSVYQVDEDNRLIRRVLGVNQPTPRQGDDGQWKEYKSIGLGGDGLLIIWEYNPDGSARCTWTSTVVADTGSGN